MAEHLLLSFHVAVLVSLAIFLVHRNFRFPLLRRSGADSSISTSPEYVLAAEQTIRPGVTTTLHCLAPSVHQQLALPLIMRDAENLNVDA